MTEIHENNNTLLLKNLPRDVEALTEILVKLQTLPIDIKPFGRRRALLRYQNTEEVITALEHLQGLTVQNRKITAIRFYKNVESKSVDRATEADKLVSRKKSKVTRSTQTQFPVVTASMPALSDYVRQLYACDAALEFSQPPPAYLRYTYPRITPVILDSICIALMSNTQFYTQVLHLMNRMNLEPPFEPRSEKKFVLPGEPRDIAIQTDLDTSQIVPCLAKHTESPEESELESSADERVEPIPKLHIKRIKQNEATQEEQYRKRARLLVQSTLLKKTKATLTTVAVGSPCSSTAGAPPPTSAKKLQELFEASTKVQASKIAVNLASKLKTAPKDAAPAVTTSTLELPSDLSTQRLSHTQMQELPLYKNYAQGTPSNKLYIKNLAKDIDAADLHAIFQRFVTQPSQLEVKVMQQGRMKGQAFVTFNGITDDQLVKVMGNALNETNGFLLKQKPMIVCFGRK